MAGHIGVSQCTPNTTVAPCVSRRGLQLTTLAENRNHDSGNGLTMAIDNATADLVPEVAQGQTNHHIATPRGNPSHLRHLCGSWVHSVDGVRDIEQADD